MNDALHFLKKKSGLFYWTSFVLLVVMLAYPLLGSALVFLVMPEPGTMVILSRFDERLLVPYRIVQVAGQVLFLGLPVFFLASLHTRQKQPFSRDTLRFLGVGRKKPARGLFTALLGLLLLQPFIYSVIEGIAYLLLHAGEIGRAILKAAEQQEEFLFYLAGADSFPEFLVVACIVALVPAFCEELFFRGFVQRNYVESLSPARGVFLTGVLFGLFHFSPANLVPLACMGWFLGYLYETSKSLVLPIGVHFSNNLVSLVALQLQRKDSEAVAGTVTEGSIDGWMMIMATAVSVPLFLFAMKRFRSLFS